jgi:hypothetical protein
VSAADFQAWAAEIQAELGEAMQALAEAETDLAAAQTTRDLARAEERRVTTLIERVTTAAQGENVHRLWGGHRPGTPTTLLRRRDPAARAADQAEGALSLAKQIVANAQRRADDAREALSILSGAMNTTEEEPSRG